MNRNSLLELSGRITHLAARVTLNVGDDLKMMQEMFIDGMNSDMRKAVERIQSFGFSSVPLPRDESDKQEKGSIGGIEQPKGPAAEGIALFLGGQRNHPVIIGVDDRRHRPMGMKPGENAQYDDQGQMTLLRRTGLFLLSLDDDGSGKAPGARMLKDGDGKPTGKSQPQQRMVSLRHVSKKAQERGRVGSHAGPPLTVHQQAAMDKANAEYKHEGDSVNTEVRCTGSKVEIYAGSTAVATYDKAANTWTLNESGGAFKVTISGDKITAQHNDNNHSFRLDGNHIHMKFGNNALWLNDGGIFSSTAIQLQADPCS
jgi:Bacteriophage Mu Gp45 spike protein